MRWSYRWRDEIKSGQYYDLLAQGFFKDESEDLEPQIGALVFYLDAFRELSTCRPGGMDLLAIPFTAIAEYSMIWGLDDFEDFSYIIRILDNTFLELNASKNEEKK